MNTIEVKNLKKYFGKTKAVNGISFDIKKGEIFGFLGPNGAGKTTTIRCLMDFIKPSSGKISILGLDAQKNSAEIKKKIGFLSGHVQLYGHWTGEDHIDLVEKIHGKSEIVDDLIKTLEYDPRARVRTLSSGNYQKLGLILALMNEPEVLILDEPTLSLDPLLQNTIYKILQEFQEKGRTIFMSSHYLSEVERICGRVGIIKEGKLIAVENIGNLKSKKIHQVKVDFIGKYKKEDFKLPGVKIESEMSNSNYVFFIVHGDISELIKKLGNYKIKDIEIQHASLEEIFLEYYGRK